MDSSATKSIPHRAQTLQVLRLIETHRPLLMLKGDDDGYGTRWVLDGEQVQPAIAKYLMNEGFIAENGATGFGAKKLTLTEAGSRFRDNGVRWWKSLGLLEKLKITVFG